MPITDADWEVFEEIAKQCKSGEFRTINVASKRRSEAIVAVWKMLRKLRETKMIEAAVALADARA